MAIVVCECQADGCSRVEHRWMGTSLASLAASTTFGSGTWLGGGFEVETRYWVVRLHAAPFWFLRGRVGVCGWSPLSWAPVWVCVVGVGLFFENCIVDASIL